MPTESEMYHEKQKGLADYEERKEEKPQVDHNNPELDEFGKEIGDPIFEISNDAHAPDEIVEKARNIVRNRYNNEDDVQGVGILPADPSEKNKYWVIVNVNKGSVGTNTIEEKFRL